VEEGLLPHRECIEENRVEEERRLMYVGITRARRSLSLSWCRKRKRAGDWQSCEPSRFIGEIGEKAESGEEPSGREDGKARLAAIRAMLVSRA
jgi:ATP-dependent DNA helicase Rep